MLKEIVMSSFVNGDKAYRPPLDQTSSSNVRGSDRSVKKAFQKSQAVSKASHKLLEFFIRSQRDLKTVGLRGKGDRDQGAYFGSALAVYHFILRTCFDDSTSADKHIFEKFLKANTFSMTLRRSMDEVQYSDSKNDRNLKDSCMKNLKKNNFMVIPCSWRKGGGHAVSVQIEQLEEGNYSIKVINDLLGIKTSDLSHV